MYETHYVPARTNHYRHGLVAVLTVGLWLPVWFYLWLRNKNRMVARRVWNPEARPQYRTGHSADGWPHVNPSHRSSAQDVLSPRYRWYQQ